MAAFKAEIKAGLGELPKLHFGHIISSLLPHFTQNLASSGLSNWHSWHFIVLQQG